MSAIFDVFNGDADGICALHQLRLTYPVAATLITGAKRDVKLLEKVTARASDAINVFDISMGQNKEALLYLLSLGVKVTYFDHHFVGTLARHPNLITVTDTAHDTCTSALVDRYLGGQHRGWAVVGAFGDGMDELARRLAAPLKMLPTNLDRLRELGQCLNYNAYGDTPADLFFHPAELYRRIKPYVDPLRFVEAEAAVVDKLREGRKEDMSRAMEATPQIATPHGAIYVLPDSPWSRRVRGEFANEVAHAHGSRAHAVLSRNANHGYTVSVRAPLSKPTRADELCLAFETGGGRPTAAGINHLVESQFDDFARRFLAHYSQ